MSSPKASGGLNPGMVYRPVSPSTPNPGPGAGTNTNYLRIDESEDPRYRFRVRLAWVIRFFFAVLTFTSLLGIMLHDVFLSSRPFIVPLFVLLWFVFIWQVLHTLPKISRVQRGISRLLPRISLQIGDASCVVGGDDDGDRGDFAGHLPPKKNLSRVIIAVVDFLFGIVLVILGALWSDYSCHYWHCYIFSLRVLPFIVISIIVGSFMIIASFFSLYNTYHTVAFEFSIYKDGTVQPISLGNPDSDFSARREPVSISA
ncbi:hypothetical protein V8F20_011558 [Naviculisporaceae sp. PSN 640]